MASEFIALASCAKEDFWIKKFVTTLSIIMSKIAKELLFDILIGEDNEACISEAFNPAHSNFSKHIDLKYHLIVDHVCENEVNLN